MLVENYEFMEKEIYVVLPIAGDSPAHSIQEKLNTQDPDIRWEQLVVMVGATLAEKILKSDSSVTGAEIKNALDGTHHKITLSTKAVEKFFNLQNEGFVIFCELDDEKEKAVSSYVWHPEGKIPS